jgi:protein O-mannosyl-transferase
MLRRIFQPWLLIPLFAGILYFPTVNYELVYLDDNVWIEDYGWLFQDWSYAFQFFTGPDFISRVFYRPLLNLTFLVDARSFFSGLIGYRVTNLVLHAGCSVLVYYVFMAARFHRGVAWAAGMIFAAHPVSVSAVAWIPGRTDSLLAFFALSSFLCYGQFCGMMDDRVKPLARLLMAVGHCLFFVLALLSKETAVVLPLICVGYTILLKGKKGLLPRHGVMGVLWLVVIVGFFWLRAAVIPGDARVGWIRIVTSVWENSPAVVSYLGKTILPVGQSVLPHRPDMTLVWGWCVLVTLAAWIVVCRSRNAGRIAFGAMWFLMFLLPALVISFLKHEYRLYLPMIGVGIMVADLAEQYLKGGSKRLLVARLITAAVILGFSFKTLGFTRNYRDRFTFWTNAVQCSPTLPLAHRNLAAMRHLEGDIESARSGYERALELNPFEPMANNNLGMIAQSKGDFKNAERLYQREIYINPEYDNVYLNFGLLRYQMGRRVDARALWEKSVEINPNFSPAWQALLGLAKEEGRRNDVRRLEAIVAGRGMDVFSGNNKK